MTAWGPFKRSEKDKEKKPPAPEPAGTTAERPATEAPPVHKPSPSRPVSAPARPQPAKVATPKQAAPGVAPAPPAKGGAVSEKGNAALHRRSQVGLVVSGKMQHTAVVVVTRLAPHPLYKKIMKFRKRFKVHNEGNLAKEGDRVRMVETRPLSKEKRWRIVEVLKA